jgi:hypothetical protein
MSSMALLFICLACTDWPEVSIVSFCLCFGESCRCVFCYGRCWCCWSELRKEAANDGSSVVCFERNILPVNFDFVARKFPLRCNSCIARLQPRLLLALSSTVILGSKHHRTHDHTSVSDDCCRSVSGSLVWLCNFGRDRSPTRGSYIAMALHATVSVWWIAPCIPVDVSERI